MARAVVVVATSGAEDHLPECQRIRAVTDEAKVGKYREEDNEQHTHDHDQRDAPGIDRPHQTGPSEKTCARHRSESSNSSALSQEMPSLFFCGLAVEEEVGTGS
jgi:hypothetical protein